MKRILFIFVLLLLAGCAHKENFVDFIHDNGKVAEINVEIADSEEEIRNGLMYRESMHDYEGMLFIFEDEAYRSFWMKNTLIPLDILFIDENKVIIDIIENFQPCEADPCESYKSKEKAMYVVEVNAGFAEKHNISIGDEVITYKVTK